MSDHISSATIAGMSDLIWKARNVIKALLFLAAAALVSLVILETLAGCPVDTNSCIFL